jgi:hypothetical protein
MRAKEFVMTLGFRNVVWAVVLMLSLGVTVTACTGAATDGNKLVINVYASPT